MAYTRKYEINGVTMELTANIIEVDREKVIKELQDREYPVTENNISRVTEMIKDSEQFDFTESLKRDFINGESDFEGDFSIFDNAFEELYDNLEED